MRTVIIQVRKALIFSHRWLGVAICILFMLWFTSGVVMMYWGFPSVTAQDRLDRSPGLETSTIRISPSEAYAKLGVRQPPSQVRLNTFDGRPVYRFRAGRGGERLVYADTGEEQTVVSQAMLQRIATAWTGQPADTARVQPVTDVDQWTVQGQLRSLRPMWKYSLPDGQQVYLNGTTGEVVQYTTSKSRFWAWLGPIPHWLYFTPLRKYQVQWTQFVIWSSGIGTVGAILGIAVGVWMYSPRKRYSYAGVAARVPYQGQKRWHMVFGLIFGVGAATWAFSGMLSMDPFPVKTGGPSTAGGRGKGGGREGGPADVPGALRGRLQLAAFTIKTPNQALAQLPNSTVTELELTSFGGEPVYLAAVGKRETRIVPVTGEASAEFPRGRIMEIVRTAIGPSNIAELRVMEDYDAYYLDRHRQKPLPVIFLRRNDAGNTRYYIDPKTARVVGTYDSSRWVTRWLYHGLHSLDFPWLYKYRPLWDIVIISFMLGGSVLSFTSLVLAWRVLRRRMKALFKAPMAVSQGSAT
jgi:hypothetical protein